MSSGKSKVRTDAEKFATAIHEASHGFGFYNATIDLEVISIRPGESCNGVTVPSAYTLTLSGHALNGMDPVMRKKADTILVAYLLGPEGESLFAQPSGDGSPVQRFPPLQPSLGPHVAARLEGLEADPDMPGDHTLAIDLAISIVGFETAAVYVEWARREARSLASRFAAPIHALALALMREEAIEGRPAFAIFDEALGVNDAQPN